MANRSFFRLARLGFVNATAFSVHLQAIGRLNTGEKNISSGFDRLRDEYDGGRALIAMFV